MSLQPPPTVRKPSEAKSLDSGYDGPSRESSASHLPSHKETNRGKEARKKKSEQGWTPYVHKSSLTGIGECSTNVHCLKSSCIGNEHFRCVSEPHFHLMDDDSTITQPDPSSPVSSNITKVHSDWGITSGSFSSPSQPSQVVQFTQNSSSINLMLSSPDSSKNLTISITISSSDNQPQPFWSKSNSEGQTLLMTNKDEEILKRTVKKNTNVFVSQTHFEMLIPFLFETELIHGEDSEALASVASHKAKGNHFYTVILPRKGKQAYRLLYKCLSSDTEHLGHKDLVELLDNALRKRPDPQQLSFHDNSSAEEDCNHMHVHRTLTHEHSIEKEGLDAPHTTTSSEHTEQDSGDAINIDNGSHSSSAHCSSITDKDNSISCHSDSVQPSSTSRHGNSACHGASTSRDDCECDGGISNRTKSRSRAKGCCIVL